MPGPSAKRARDGSLKKEVPTYDDLLSTAESLKTGWRETLIEKEKAMPTMDITFTPEEIRGAIRFWLLAKLPTPLGDNAETAYITFVDDDGDETDECNLKATMKVNTSHGNDRSSISGGTPQDSN